MTAITKPAPRKIIDDFTKEIREKRQQTVKPSIDVINFRTDIADGVERIVWRVPIELLRYRKDNGRIASDILDYERNIGVLDERDDQAQKQIREFIEEKDPERTAVLIKSILHAGQKEPAIITCDAFLINGNRRKMVMDKLHVQYPDNDTFGYMKVVILPGIDDEGGPPDLLEIEKIENRYQLQCDGKSEYYGFDRALSIQRKITLGLSLKEQLSDDPRFARATEADLTKAITECQKTFLNPLACVERYLKQFGRDGLYRTISTGISDPEGRWQAFIDYSNSYVRYFSNPKRRIDFGIEDDEIGVIEEAAFDIIRLRAVPGMPKVHVIMRELPKYCRTTNGKKAVKKIAEEVDPILPRNDLFDANNEPLSLAEVDDKWAARNKEHITYNLSKAARSHEHLKDRETPIGLLEAALKKLTHDEMDLTTIRTEDYGKARALAADIQKKANELERQIYSHQKQFKKLLNKQ